MNKAAAFCRDVTSNTMADIVKPSEAMVDMVKPPDSMVDVGLFLS